MTSDPFDALRITDEPTDPPTDFRRDLRARLVEAMGLAPTTTISLPERTPMTATMTTTTTTTAIPYLAVHDGAAAMSFYAAAFGAIELSRFDMEDGRLGHAEFRIGSATFYLSDEFPEIGVRSPNDLGGSTVTLHLTVDDVDTAFARAVEAGATSQNEPADQPHSSRHGSLFDPFGHRWMLSQPLTPGRSPASGGRSGGVWAGVFCADPHRIGRLAVEVFGFEERQVVPDGAGGVAHSEYTWPTGGTVMIVSAPAPSSADVLARTPAGQAHVYMVADDVPAIHSRCVAADLAIVRPLETPEHDPTGSTFTVEDPEGNTWSFGTYGGEAGSGG